VTLLLIIAQIYGEIIVEFLYNKTYVSACRPLFPNPLWEWLTALVSAFIALFFLKVFRIKNQALILLISLHLYILVYVLLQYYLGSYYFYEVFHIIYVSTKTFIFSITFLYLSVL